MASNSSTDKELQAIHKELKELNRSPAESVEPSIFSLDEPVIRVKPEDWPENSQKLQRI